MVPLSKSGVRKHRGFESHPLRHHRAAWTPDRRVAGSAPSLTHLEVRSVGCSPGALRSAVPAALQPPESRRLPHVRTRAPSGRGTIPTSRRGRLVDYGAALEMRFAATRRGFESRPLRHPRRPSGRRWRRRPGARPLTHDPRRSSAPPPGPSVAAVRDPSLPRAGPADSSATWLARWHKRPPNAGPPGPPADSSASWLARWHKRPPTVGSPGPPASASHSDAGR